MIVAAAPRRQPAGPPRRPEPAARGRADAGRFRRQCQPRAAHAARDPDRLHRDAAGRGRGRSPRRAQRFVGIMCGEAMRMRDLLDDLMSLSRIEAERFALPRETGRPDAADRGGEGNDLKPLRQGPRDPDREQRRRGAGQRRPRPARADARPTWSSTRSNMGAPGTPVRIRLDDAGARPRPLERDRQGRRHRRRPYPAPHRALLPGRSGPQPRRSAAPASASPSSSISCCAIAAGSTSRASPARAPASRSFCRAPPLSHHCNKPVTISSPKRPSRTGKSGDIL